jgi:zinc protease
MIEKPNITPDALNAERPVVLAEQREQPGAQVRLGDAVRQTFFAGQPIAERSPIGNIKTLEAATAEAVKAFHDRWYRPSRVVVIVSGDVDPALSEKLVQKNFVSWQDNAPPVADPDFGKPDPKQPPARAVVEPSLPPIVTYAVLRPWQYRDDTIIFNQKRLVDLVALRVINRRLETRARTGGSYLQASVSLSDVSRSANGTFVNLIPAGSDWEGALRDVRAVIADALATAPSQADVDRELTEFDAAMKNEVDTARAEAGAKQADDLVEALDIRETVTTAQTAYEILQDARKKGLFTAAAVLDSTRRVFTGDATHALVNLRSAEPQAEARLVAALNANVSDLAGKRKKLASVDFSKLPSLGKPGEIVEQSTVTEFGVQRVVFKNGVRLLVLPSKSEAGRVYVRVGFGGGYNALPTNAPSPAWAGDQALVASGIAGFGQDALDALTAGRRIGLDLSIDEDSFSISAITTPADMSDNLYLIAEKLVYPTWDPSPLQRAKAVAETAYSGYDASPTGILSRDLEELLHDHDPRWKTPTLDEIKGLTPKAFRDFWAPILASGQIEVDVFGDITNEQAIAATARSLGAIKPRKADTITPPPVRFPAHNASPVVLTHSGPENQAVAVIGWPTGGGLDSISDSRRLEVLAAIFSDRLFDRLRSDAGASYSPSVNSQWPVGMPGGGRVLAVGQVPPDKVDFFFKLSREIAADLASKPIEADELKRALLPMIEYLNRVSTGNTFWLTQLAGGSYDARKFTALSTLGRDLQSINPTELQRVAAQYLRPEADFTLAVVPEKKKPAN